MNIWIGTIIMGLFFNHAFGSNSSNHDNYAPLIQTSSSVVYGSTILTSQRPLLPLYHQNGCCTCRIPTRDRVEKVACQGGVPCCPRVSKFGVWVMSIGASALGLTTWLCLRRLEHYDSGDDDGSGLMGLFNKID